MVYHRKLLFLKRDWVNITFLSVFSHLENLMSDKLMKNLKNMKN